MDSPTDPIVSVLVPFRHEPGTTRRENWIWLAQRWKMLLPEAELVVGTDYGEPFSKTVAVNDAYSRSRGKVLVLADADSWCERPALLRGIGSAIETGVLTIPWHQSYRLAPEGTAEIVAYDPQTPNLITQEIKSACTDFQPGPETAAMLTILTRESFQRVGGMDPRFRGWGNEDVSFAIACRTMLGEAKIFLGEAYALWHSRPRADTGRGKGMRVWANDQGAQNHDLIMRYKDADKDPEAMAALCAEHPIDSVQPTPKPGLIPSPSVLVREFAYTVTGPDERIVL